MFWISLIIQIGLPIVATILWLEIGREQVRRVLPRVTNRSLDISVAILFLVSAAVSVIVNIQSERQNKLLEESLHKAQEEQQFYTLISRAESYDADAFFGLMNVTSTNSKLSSHLKKVIENIKERLARDRDFW